MTDPNIGEETLNKIGVIPVFLKIGWAFYKHLLTGPFRGENAPPTWRRDISYGVIREVVSGLSALQAQWLSPSTNAVYKGAMRKRNLQPLSFDLADGAKGHWIGSPDAQYVMIYFHGGGYISASTPGHMKYQFNLQKEMTAKGYSFSIFTLSYTLAPHALYPGQLRQAASALTHVLEHDKRDPSTIILGGDSAGGNLVSVLLLHLARPHPQVKPINLSSPLHAALLISPWVSFETETESFTKNARSDYLTKRALNRASYAFIGKGKEHDFYSQPILAPAEWWKDVANKAVEDMMICGGGGELLIDGIRKYAGTITEGFEEADGDTEKSGEEKSEKTTSLTGKKRVHFVESPREAHEEMIIDIVIRKGGKGAGAKAVDGWLSARL